MKIPTIIVLLILSVSVFTTTARAHEVVLPSRSDFELIIENSLVKLEISDPQLRSNQSIILDWIRYSADAVKNYYGEFPVKEVWLQLNAYEGSGVRSGHAYGGEIPFIEINIGDRVSERELKKDWVLVHEMIHLALAELPRRHHWFVEGLAVYIESVSRVNAGRLDQDIVWKSFFNGMPKGLPKAGDQGLDHTPTWGRRYWGGALFCLLADIEIRQRTNNNLSLQDAMRGILRAGYSMNREADIQTLLKMGDQTTGQNVLVTMYQQMKAKPVTTDLPELWQSLGVSLVNGTISYDNEAPLASIRSKIFK